MFNEWATLIANARGWVSRYGDTFCSTVFQLSETSEGTAKHGHDVLPRVWRADGDIIPRIWARLGVLAAQYAPKDEPVEIDKVVQTQLEKHRGHNTSRGVGGGRKKMQGRGGDTHRVKEV
jgi:hypothetical protein